MGDTSDAAQINSGIGRVYIGDGEVYPAGTDAAEVSVGMPLLLGTIPTVTFVVAFRGAT